MNKKCNLNKTLTIKQLLLILVGLVIADGFFFPALGTCRCILGVYEQKFTNIINNFTFMLEIILVVRIILSICYKKLTLTIKDILIYIFIGGIAFFLISIGVMKISNIELNNVKMTKYQHE